MNVYERDSIEIARVTVRKEGVVADVGVSFCIKEPTRIPVDTDWIPAIFTEDGDTGIMVEGLDRGTYVIWARLIDEPEDVISRAGLIRIL